MGSYRTAALVFSSRRRHTRYWPDWSSDVCSSDLTVVSYPRAKSPTPGRSTFITRAPRSASWRVAKGAATACSRETTVTPSSGSILERPRQAEDVLADVGEDQVRRDGRDLEEPGLAELPLDVVLGVVGVAAEG